MLQNSKIRVRTHSEYSFVVLCVLIAILFLVTLYSFSLVGKTWFLNQSGPKMYYTSHLIGILCSLFTNSNSRELNSNFDFFPFFRVWLDKVWSKFNFDITYNYYIGVFLHAMFYKCKNSYSIHWARLHIQRVCK